MGEPLHHSPRKLLGPTQGVERARLPFTHQHLARLRGLQPALEASTGRKRAQPQHLKGLRRRPMVDLKLPVVNTARAVVWQLRQRVCQHRPSGCCAPQPYSLLISGTFRGQSTPRPRHHNTRLIGVQRRNDVIARGGGWSTRNRAAIKAKAAAELLQVLLGGMQGFVEGEIEMHRAWCTTLCIEGGLPSPDGKLLDTLGCQQVQPSPGAGAEPAADRLQKRLLIHRLIGATVFEAIGPVRGDQQ